MLLLQQRQYYQYARFGDVRGSEPAKYVYNTPQRYLAYAQLTCRLFDSLAILLGHKKSNNKCNY